MTQRRRILSAGLSVAMSMVPACTPAASQVGSQAPPKASAYTQTEYSASQAVKSEQDLDQFIANYPDSVLLPSVYRTFYLAYWRLNSYAEAILYVDKLLALGEKVDVETRLEALVTRAQAFVNGCQIEALQTPEAYARARDTATQGLQTISEWQKPANLTDEQYVAEKKSTAIIFDAAAAMGKSGLSDPKVACKSPLTPSVAAPDPGRFDRMINEILQEQRQTSRVR